VDSKTKTTLLVILACSSLLILTGPRPGKAQALTPHLPIYIACNIGFPSCAGTQYENFTSLAGITGRGLPGDPYIISDLEIITSSTYGIHIRNTISYFIIRNVLIQRTSYTGQSEGIYLDNARNGRVENSRITNFFYGTWVSSGQANALVENSMWNNTQAIYITGRNTIASGNHLYNNQRYGAYVTSPSNILTGNNASANGTTCPPSPPAPPGCQSDGAGFLVSSSNNLFENNMLADNTWFGIKIIGSSTTASSNNIVRYNFVSRNGNATGGGGIIFADNASRNQVIGNYVTKETNAVGLENVDNVANSYNNITSNQVARNTSGIYLFNSPQNTIYNNYLNNTTNAIDNTNQNSWNITKTTGTNILCGPFLGGNFYSDYSGGDPDSDGIGDTPYAIAGGTAHDLLPLVLNQPVNQPPVASFTLNSTTLAAGQAIMLDASGSHDPDGTISSYSWNLGDGTTSMGVSINHVYATAGSYEVTLNVLDICGAHDAVTQSLTVLSNRPSTPLSLNLTAKPGNATLTWAPPSYTGGSPIILYMIFRKLNSSGSFANIANATGTSYVDAAVSMGQTYDYFVKAVNSANIVSDPSTSYEVLVPIGSTNNSGGSGGSGNSGSNGDLTLWLIITGIIIIASVSIIGILRRKRNGSSPRRRRKV
jgi:parallel beta-helix repeat protein